MSLEPEDPVKEVEMFYWLSCSIIKKLVPLAGFMERDDLLNSIWHYFFFPNWKDMSCKVAYELENKTPKVKTATLHPVMEKILVCIALCLHYHMQKEMFSTDAREIEHVCLTA